jgi:hypothetical protein
MSFIYPRTIAVTRPAAQAGVGPIGYGGETIATETAVVSGIAASIQISSGRGIPPTGLPGDAKRTFWNVLIQLGAVANGVIETRDIVTDDLGVRYQVAAPYWNSLGYQLLVERLEA